MSALDEVKAIRRSVHETTSLSSFITSKEPAYLSKLVSYIQHEEDEVAQIALEVVHFMVTEANSSNRKEIAKEPGLMPEVRQLMMSFTAAPKIKSYAIQIYTNLQSYATAEAYTTYTKEKEDPKLDDEEEEEEGNERNTADLSTQTTDRVKLPSTGGGSMSIFRAAAASSSSSKADALGSATRLTGTTVNRVGAHNTGAAIPGGGGVGLALFSSSVSNRLAAAHTHTIFIKGLKNKPENRTTLEKTLLGVKGTFLNASLSLSYSRKWHYHFNAVHHN